MNVQSAAQRRVGVFGGTFDPPHIGHLVTALNVRHELSLDEVLLVVANRPWQKAGSRPITPAEIRLDLVRAAVAGVDGLTACSIEIDRGGDTYTVDTLTELRAAHPDTDFLLILGGDAAAGLDTWRRAEELPSLADIVVVERPGDSSPVPEGFPAHHVVVPRLEVSSTDLRDRIRTGRPVRFLLPEAVGSLIEERGLYRCADPT